MASAPPPSGNDRTPGRANSLGLNEKVLNELLDLMDRSQSAEAAKRRQYTRLQYRRPSVVLAVKTPDGTDTVTKVACRNLSSGGISILHSAFLHQGSVCVVVLEHPVHGNTPVKGRVSRCQHRSGLLHEIGIRFDEQINPRDYLNNDTPLLTIENIHPDKLTGTVVHLSTAAEDRQAVRDMLRDLPLQVKSVATFDDLLAQIALGSNAILIQSIAANDLPAQISAIQAACNSPICVLGMRNTPGTASALAATRVLNSPWPTTQPALRQVMAEMLLALAPGALRDSVNQNAETLGKIVQVAQTLGELADGNSGGPLAKALAEISRLATLIARHDLVDLAARARSGILELTKPEPAKLRQLVKPLLDSVLPDTTAAAA